MSRKAKAILAGVFLVGSCAGALARPAITTFNANLRSGPGVDTPVVSIVPDQSLIDVGSCTGSWCRVNWDGSEGWLSRTLIASVSARRAIVPGPAVAPDVVAPGCDPADASCVEAYDQGYDSSYADNGAYDYGNDYGLPLGIGIGIDGGYYGGGYYGRGYGSRPFYGSRTSANAGFVRAGGTTVVHASGPAVRSTGAMGHAAMGRAAMGSSGRAMSGGHYAVNRAGRAEPNFR